MEQWKDIENYEGLYQISNLGRVKSLNRMVFIKSRNIYRKIEGRILNPILDKKGYLRVDLCKYNKRKSTRVHRLVASAFVNSKNNALFVNHIDMNKINNNASNLEWCTAQENSQHFFNNGGSVIRNTEGEKNGRSKLKESDILLIRKLKGKLSMSKIAYLFGVSLSQIKRVVYRWQWDHI